MAAIPEFLVTASMRPVEWLATDVPRDSFDQDLLYSFGAFLTFGRVKRDHAEERIRATMRGDQPPREDQTGEEVTTEDEEALNVDALAREQVRQTITRSFAGHDLARLVGAILSAQGLTVAISPPGADQGVDILAGAGPLGLDSPRIVVQVKTGQAGVDEFRSLRGLVNALDADQGVLVAWRGFKGTVRSEARREHFLIRLWDGDDLLDALFSVYDDLADDVRSKLPLHTVWALVRSEE